MPMKFGTSIGIGYALAHVTLLALRHHVTQRSSSHWARTHAHTHSRTHAHTHTHTHTTLLRSV